MKFYIGQKVEYVFNNTLDNNSLFEIIGLNYGGDYKKKVIKYLKDLGTASAGHISWVSNDDIRPVEKNNKYKIGDKLLFSSPLYKSPHVEIVGFPVDKKANQGLFYVRMEDGSVVTAHGDNLYPLPQPLKEGQEVWIKAITRIPSLPCFDIINEGECAVTIRRNFATGGIANDTWAFLNDVYLKDGSGNLISYGESQYGVNR